MGCWVSGLFGMKMFEVCSGMVVERHEDCEGKRRKEHR